MAFNPNNYKPAAARKLPVVLLLDVSGSMAGEKIDTLYDSVVEMVNSFVEQEIKETIIDVSIITFGNSVELHTPYTSVKELQKNGIGKFYASGMTPMGMALTMAKDMIEDKDATPRGNYKPAVVLVSDGQPNDSWERPLDSFIRSGRSAKCQRFAIAIGNDADRSVLERFTGDSAAVLFAEDASDLVECFKKVTMSVSTRATSKNPDTVPNLSRASFDNNSGQMDDDDDPYI
ncbi:MAG: VWA domain-containing protein [Clostridiaceae bacterium]|nr:VWA domain-containing protein [Clostridiaceae bacterium]